MSSKTSLSSRENHAYAREGPKLPAEHEQIVQCQDAAALQSDRCTTVQGHSGGDKLHVRLFSKHYQVPTRARPCARYRRCNN